MAEINLTDEELELVLSTLLFSCTPQIVSYWESEEEDKMFALAKKLKEQTKEEPKLPLLTLHLDYATDDQSNWTPEEIADNIRCEAIDKEFDLQVHN